GIFVTFMFLVLPTGPILTAEASPCENISGSISGSTITRPPQAGGDWSFTITSGPALRQNKGVVKGVVTGTFTASDFGIDSSTEGTWLFRNSDGALFIKLVGAGFRADLALQNLPSPGFTFSGNLFVDGVPQPVALVKTTGGIACG
ncbi:MAG: hypothetical protein HYU02_06900, partial [Thaumarchaeota archaeon]|nr:hypothetical protein [Nitrososphaerota archaeon]